VLVVSTLPPFQAVVDARKNNALGAWFSHLLAKKGGQKAPIWPGRKICEPHGPVDRDQRTMRWRDPEGLLCGGQSFSQGGVIPRSLYTPSKIDRSKGQRPGKDDVFLFAR
jgi:hypothetical protein